MADLAEEKNLPLMIEVFDLRGDPQEAVVLLAIPKRLVRVEREPPGGAWSPLEPGDYALDRRILTLHDQGPVPAGRLYVMYRVQSIMDAVQNLGRPGP